MRLIVILLISMINNKIVIAARKSGHSYSAKRQQNQHTNISKLLDKLLENYDNSLRPDFGYEPAIVEIDLMVRSMGPVSEIEMTYSMDCYFRQSWVDRRLAFEDFSSSNVTTLALSISMLKKIWKPDTFIFNGKQSYLHTITTPNKFVRLHNDGRVLYSSRLTIKAACPMSLENFPMDVQRCPLKLGSFGYTTKDILYRWNPRAVAISEDLRMSQFDLIDIQSSNESLRAGGERHGRQSKNGVSEYSVLLVSFHLQRHMGNFLIQVYGPCVLLVILSWVSFWLNREATADRISLGITTVLTMTFLGLESRTDLPKLTYLSALDIFVFISFAFIFATILQFAIVHYFTKIGSGETYFDFNESSEEETDEEENALYRASQSVNTMSSSHLSSLSQIDIYGVIPLSRLEIDFTKEESRVTRTLKRCKKFMVNYVFCRKLFTNDNVDDGVGDDREESINESEQQIPSAEISEDNTAQSTPHNQPQNTENINRNIQRGRRTFNSVSKVDKFSRLFFPLLYLAINLIYWVFYLSRSQRK